MHPQLIDRIFLALADPGRREMVERLSRGPATVTELAMPTGMRLPSAVKHLRLLEDSGIVASHKTGRTRTYKIEPRSIDAIGAWVREREAAWQDAFDRLSAAMLDVKTQENSNDRTKG